MQNLLRKLSRYFVTGGIAAVVDAGGFALLERAGVVTPVAASLSFCVAALMNYVLTARFVFGQQATARVSAVLCRFARRSCRQCGGHYRGNCGYLIAPDPGQTQGDRSCFFREFHNEHARRLSSRREPELRLVGLSTDKVRPFRWLIRLPVCPAAGEAFAICPSDAALRHYHVRNPVALATRSSQAAGTVRRAANV